MERKEDFLYQRYNQSQEMLGRETRYDPEFWEIRVDPEDLGRFAASSRLHYEPEEDVQAREDRLNWVDETFPVVMEMIDDQLTPRQGQIVRMYFLDQMTEREISAKLDISVASVSQHLFGKMRGGKRVGGAIPKLRRELRESKRSMDVSVSCRTD
jgi:RNA polymerase sigma factor (sigma-70 family)